MKIFPAAPHEFDRHQSTFHSALDRIQDKADAEAWDGMGVIGLRGFPAAKLDLGWIKDHLQRWIDEEKPDFDRLKETLFAELGKVVQRHKRLEIKPQKPESPFHDVIIVTKDDRGYYEYRFHVKLEHQIRSQSDSNSLKEK